MNIFPIGTQVTLLSDHMPGMQQAKAVITKAVLTNYYQITYQPTDNSPTVNHHKWIIQSEIKDAPRDLLLNNSFTFTCLATHMPGMYGAQAQIETSHFGVVYELSYIPTTSPDKIIPHHKWFTVDEVDLREVATTTPTMNM